MDAEAFRKYGKEMVDFVADYWQSLPTRKPLPEVKPGYIWDLVRSFIKVVLNTTHTGTNRTAFGAGTVGQDLRRHRARGSSGQHQLASSALFRLLPHCLQLPGHSWRHSQRRYRQHWLFMGMQPNAEYQQFEHCRNRARR